MEEDSPSWIIFVFVVLFYLLGAVRRWKQKQQQKKEQSMAPKKQPSRHPINPPQTPQKKEKVPSPPVVEKQESPITQTPPSKKQKPLTVSLQVEKKGKKVKKLIKNLPSKRSLVFLSEILNPPYFP